MMIMLPAANAVMIERRLGDAKRRDIPSSRVALSHRGCSNMVDIIEIAEKPAGTIANRFALNMEASPSKLPMRLRSSLSGVSAIEISTARSSQSAMKYHSIARRRDERFIETRARL